MPGAAHATTRCWIFRTGYDQRAAGQPVRRSQIVATFLLSQAVEKQAKQTLIAPQGPFPMLNNGSWACRRCVSLALTSTAGASTSAPTPFCGGVPQDVRITTRYNENDLLSALFGVIHETGHARYEQNLPRPWVDQP